MTAQTGEEWIAQRSEPGLSDIAGIAQFEKELVILGAGEGTSKGIPASSALVKTMSEQDWDIVGEGSQCSTPTARASSFVSTSSTECWSETASTVGGKGESDPKEDGESGIEDWEVVESVERD